MTDVSPVQREVKLGSVVLTDWPFLNLFGATFQGGDQVTAVLSSFLQDGDLEVSQQRGNMSLTIPIMVEESDQLALAQAEALLAVEAQKPTNTLTITPGDGYAPATVFETFQADIDFDFDDEREIDLNRHFVIKVNALPFGRSDFEVTAKGINVGPAPVDPEQNTLSNASSFAGWSSATGTLIQISPGAIGTESTSAAPELTFTAPMDFTAMRFIEFDWYAVFVETDYVTATLAPSLGSPVQLERMATVLSSTSGYLSTIFKVPDGIESGDSVTFTSPALATPGIVAGFGADNLSQTNTPLGGITGRQQLQDVEVAGSARTQGRLEIASPTQGLGDVLVYTYADDMSGYQPSLRPFITAGVGAVDAPGNISGLYNQLGFALDCQIPVAGLPVGNYALIARAGAAVTSPDSTPLTWTLQITRKGLLGDQPVGRVFTDLVDMTLPGDGSSVFVPLATFDLPSTGFAAGASLGKQLIRLESLTANPSPTRIQIDDLYLCNLSTGRLTVVRCGTGIPEPGGPASHLWLDPATLAARVGAVLKGTAADRSDAYFAGDDIQALGLHEFTPKRVKAFLAASGADDYEVTLRHFPRWYGHAALANPDPQTPEPLDPDPAPEQG